MNLYQKYLDRARKNNTSIQGEMFSEYKKFIMSATRNQTIEYLEVMEPARLQIIRDTMQEIDTYFNKNDYQNFMKTINKSLGILKQDIY